MPSSWENHLLDPLGRPGREITAQIVCIPAHTGLCSSKLEFPSHLGLMMHELGAAGSQEKAISLHALSHAVMPAGLTAAQPVFGTVIQPIRLSELVPAHRETASCHSVQEQPLSGNIMFYTAQHCY